MRIEAENIRETSPSADDSAQVLPIQPPAPELPASQPGGQFRSGDPGPRLGLGLRSRLLADGALLPPGAALPAEREAAVLADLGDTSTMQRALVRRFVHAELVAEWLESNLVAQGVLTGKGRSRAAVSVYLSVVDRLVRLGSLLGLERRSKDVGTLEQWLDRQSKD